MNMDNVVKSCIIKRREYLLNLNFITVNLDRLDPTKTL